MGKVNEKSMTNHMIIISVVPLFFFFFFLFGLNIEAVLKEKKSSIKVASSLTEKLRCMSSLGH